MNQQPAQEPTIDATPLVLDADGISALAKLLLNVADVRREKETNTKEEP